MAETPHLSPTSCETRPTPRRSGFTPAHHPTNTPQIDSEFGHIQMHRHHSRDNTPLPRRKVRKRSQGMGWGKWNPKIDPKKDPKRFSSLVISGADPWRNGWRRHPEIRLLASWHFLRRIPTPKGAHSLRTAQAPLIQLLHNPKSNDIPPRRDPRFPHGMPITPPAPRPIATHCQAGLQPRACHVPIRKPCDIFPTARQHDLADIPRHMPKAPQVGRVQLILRHRMAQRPQIRPLDLLHRSRIRARKIRLLWPDLIAMRKARRGPRPRRIFPFCLCR